MPDKLSVPLAAVVTTEQIKACVEAYPEIAEAHYETRIKDPKKVADAIERDTWRYHGLPASLKEQYASNAKDAPLDLPQLEKLVQWKITHGHSRPFLPAMIRKNDPNTVKAVMEGGAEQLNALLKPSHGTSAGDTVLDEKSAYQAIETFCRLTGVGPATGSLIASIYAPAEVPFFADETFEWLSKAANDTLKLKYNKKEYMTMFDAVTELRLRLGREKIGCLDVEKAAFVLMHSELLDFTTRAGLEETLRDKGKTALGKPASKITNKGTQHESTNEKVKQKKGPLAQGSKRMQRMIEPADDATKADEVQRRSKRVKT